MLEVLGRATSINVRKVLWTCAELGLEYRHTPWGEGPLSLADPAFLALNPHGLVPVLRDGDFTLSESNSICRYLVSRAGRDDLLPVDLQRRALVEQWMDWQATELNTAWRYAFMALVRQNPAFTDADAIDASVRNWNRKMTLLDEVLQARDGYVLGSDFTLADVVLGLTTHRWFMTPMNRPSLPAVAAYYERLSTRPAFRAHGRNGHP